MTRAKGRETATIDRFEGGIAILQVKGKALEIARARLPKKAREGDVIDLRTLIVDLRETAQARRSVTDLVKTLRKKQRKAGDFKL